MNPKLTWIVFFLLFSFLQVQANPKTEKVELQKQVSGTVTDPEGVPLAGANIVEKGTSNGTQTDFDGNFSLEVGDDAVLVVSYIDFDYQIIPDVITLPGIGLGLLAAVTVLPRTMRRPSPSRPCSTFAPRRSTPRATSQGPSTWT